MRLGFIVGRGNEVYRNDALKKKTPKKFLVDNLLHVDVAIAMTVKENYPGVDVDIILPNLLSDATNSDSVELLALTFCLVELLIIAPFPSVNTIPVWLFMSGCTANAASTYHVKICVSSASNVRISSLVSFKKPSVLTNLHPSRSRLI